MKTTQEIWDHAEIVAIEITKLFPPPISLAFEEVIYMRFCILSKKRYMYTECYRDGIVKDKIGKKGCVLARRDNSVFIRDIYQEIITKIFNYASKEDIYQIIIDEINRLCSNSVDISKFVITKAVGDAGDFTPESFVNEKGVKKAKIGNYTVPLLCDDTKEEQMTKKKAVNEKDYYMKCLPAQVQLAEKMKRRGQRVDTGTRLEYVITENGGHTATQNEKIESFDYFKTYSNILKIDFLYYIKLLSNPMDQLVNVAFKEKDFVLWQYKLRLNRVKVIEEIKSLTKSKLIFK